MSSISSVEKHVKKHDAPRHAWCGDLSAGPSVVFHFGQSPQSQNQQHCWLLQPVSNQHSTLPVHLAGLDKHGTCGRRYCVEQQKLDLKKVRNQWHGVMATWGSTVLQTSTSIPALFYWNCFRWSEIFFLSFNYWCNIMNWKGLIKVKNKKYYKILYQILKKFGVLWTDA